MRIMMKKLQSPGIVLIVVLFLEGTQLCFCRNSTFVWVEEERQAPPKLKQSFKDASNRNTILGCIEGERKALLTLKQSFEDPSNRLVSWSGEDCCQWRGVGCDTSTRHVVKLDLSVPSFPVGNGLTNFNYTELLLAVEVHRSLAELKQLEYLDLSGNDFNQSPIPEFFASFKHLRHLNLSEARFGGKIPDQLGNLTNLALLDLSKLLDDEDYYGGEPLFAKNLQWASTLSSLQRLDLSGANLSGAFDLMRVLSRLPSLLHLNLRLCGIQNIHFATGSINSTFPANIQSLDLSYNAFAGPIPNALNNMTSLRSLDISSNSFNSTVDLLLVNSKTLANLDISRNHFGWVEGGLFSLLNKARSLKLLDLSHNHFGGDVLISNTSLSRSNESYDLESLNLLDNPNGGNMPHWLGQLKGLKYLHLGENSLHGLIPASLGKLSKLRVLFLFDNQLSGSIPQSLGNLPSLETLDLSKNKLSGSVLQSLGNLSILETLDLSQTNLSGSIPQSLRSFSALKCLDLSNNTLSGLIPESLGNLRALESLDLSHNQLSGHVPESIGQLVNLRSLDISSNHLNGVFSESHLANLSRLYAFIISSNHLTCKFKPDWIPKFSLRFLNMSSCAIGSQFPTWIQTQKHILILDLSNSSIFGTFPTLFHGIYLSYLDLSNNKINGNPLADVVGNFPSIERLLLGNNTISGSIPNSLCKLRNLQVLDLSRNGLSGEIPHCWKEMQRLVVINLSSNKLSGKIIGSPVQLSYLKRFHVNENNFEGELPQALRNCTGLQLLDVGENKFSGSIPAWIGKSFPSIRILSLRKNALNGRIPLQICELDNLQFLDLSENNLIGEIPRCFGNLSGMSTVPLDPSSIPGTPISMPLDKPRDDDPEWKREKLPVVTKGLDLEFTKMQLQLLYIIDLSSNNLTGVIPDELCFLDGLLGLNLSNNHLSGKVPNRIGDLKSLETLDLSNNRLLGAIPPSMSGLPFISHLNLSNNEFSGKIPTSDQLQTLTDPSIYTGNVGLCGYPLQNKCPSDDDTVQPPTPNADHRDDKKEKIWFWFVVTSGYAIGLWGVIGTLVLKRNVRIAYFRLVDDAKEWILVIVAVKVSRLKQRIRRT